MKEKLRSIFDFLKKNRSFNTRVQTGFYQDTLAPYQESTSKTQSLLWQIQRTQSRPKLSNVSKFWKEIEGKEISSFKSLLVTLETESEEQTYLNLFQTLKRLPSWGDKTSALFVKALFHLHEDKRYNQFSFLDDAPKLNESDKLYLPVDQVIINIFREISQKKYLSFNNINKLLDDYTGNKMEVWDDLWFWGFVTQKGTGEERDFIWNDEKYWSLLHTPKDIKSLRVVEKKANEFIGIVKAKQ